MKNFDWTKFSRKIAVKAEITDIYNAWTKASEIEKWFLSDAKFYDTYHQLIKKEDAVKEGFSYEWSWYSFDQTESGRITEANGVDYLQFTFAGECLTEIKLSSIDEYVIVELLQKNIPTDENSKQSIRLGCDSGWSFYLVNLKSFYENGADLRNKKLDFKGMINN